MKRYNLVLPESVYEEIQKIAGEHHVTAVEVIRRFLKLGLLVAQNEKEGGLLLVRDDKGERELVFY